MRAANAILQGFFQGGVQLEYATLSSYQFAAECAIAISSVKQTLQAVASDTGSVVWKALSGAPFVCCSRQFQLSEISYLLFLRGIVNLCEVVRILLLPRFALRALIWGIFLLKCGEPFEQCDLHAVLLFLLFTLWISWGRRRNALLEILFIYLREPLKLKPL